MSYIRPILYLISYTRPYNTIQYTTRCSVPTVQRPQDIGGEGGSLFMSMLMYPPTFTKKGKLRGEIIIKNS